MGVILRVIYTKAPGRLVHVVSLPGFALLSSSETIRNLLTLQATSLIETHEQFALTSRGRAVSLNLLSLCLALCAGSGDGKLI